MVQCIFKHIVKYPMKFACEIQSEYGYILFVSFYPCAFATLWIGSDVCRWLWMNRWLTPNSRKQWQEACDLSNLYVEHEEISMSISFSPEQIKYVLLLGLRVYSKRTTDLKPNQAQQSTANKYMNGIDFLMLILTFITPKAIITIRYAIDRYAITSMRFFPRYFVWLPLLLFSWDPAHTRDFHFLRDWRWLSAITKSKAFNEFTFRTHTNLFHLL